MEHAIQEKKEHFSIFIVEREIYRKPLYTSMLLIKCYLQVLFVSNLS